MPLTKNPKLGPETSLQKRLLRIVEGFARCRVVIVGDIIVDEFIYGKPSRLSREAPVPILRYDGATVVPGGAGNAASNVGTLGGDSALVGLLGRGEGDRSVYRALRGKVDTSLLVRPVSYRGPVKTRILAGGQHSTRQQLVRVDRESSGFDTAIGREFERVALSAIADADAVIVSDYGSGLVTSSFVSRLKTKLTRRRRRRAIPVVVDSRYNLEQFRGCTAYTPNQSEVEEAVGVKIGDDIRLLEKAGRALLKRTGGKGLVVTRGSKGMAIFEPKRRTSHIPIFGTDEVADVTGAGDTVIASLALALSVGASLYEAACVANYAGGLVVMKQGTATVRKDELVTAVESDGVCDQ